MMILVLADFTMISLTTSKQCQKISIMSYACASDTQACAFKWPSATAMMPTTTTLPKLALVSAELPYKLNATKVICTSHNLPTTIPSWYGLIIICYELSVSLKVYFK